MRIIKLTHIAIYFIQEWGAKYMNALVELPKKRRVEVEIDRVEIKILVKTHEQLNNNIDISISSYMNLHTRLEALV